MNSQTKPVSAAEVQKRFGFYQEKAGLEPVLIAEDGRLQTVLISYEAFVRLQRHERRAYSIEDLPSHLVDDILSCEIPTQVEAGKP